INGTYFISKIPKGEKAWFVALKYENGAPFLCIKEIVTDKLPISFELQETTLEELQKMVKKLNG
ncbi:MAG: hypothetical protein IT258_19190, partial [Saprospiraceae bacterium]|nr:hypothetical protein [Saprospiraceae bacterium]